MILSERFVQQAVKALAPPITEREHDLQGVCHELLEIIEGQEYIIEDAQFAIGYASRLDGGYQDTLGATIDLMEQAKQLAQNLYENAFNCRGARERAGFEVER